MYNPLNSKKMNKKEQIMQLVKEWQEEDSENRTVSLTMITAKNKTEEGEDLNVEGGLSGKEGHLINFFDKVLRDKSIPLHGILHKAHSRYMATRFCGFLDRLSKGIEEEPADGSENATEGDKSSENNDNK